MPACENGGGVFVGAIKMRGAASGRWMGRGRGDLPCSYGKGPMLLAGAVLRRRGHGLTLFICAREPSHVERQQAMLKCLSIWLTRTSIINRRWPPRVIDDLAADARGSKRPRSHITLRTMATQHSWQTRRKLPEMDI